MGGDNLTDEEIEIVLGKVNYPSLVRGCFKDITDVTAQVDTKIEQAKEEIKKLDKELAKSSERLGK